MTEIGVVVGTPAFMAPEQANDEAVDARTDLFSLGCVLYRMTTGELPFTGKNTLSVLSALANRKPRPVEELNPETPRPLAQLISQLLKPNPADRPASAEAVVEQLSALAAAPPTRRRPRFPWALAGLAGAPLVLFALWLIIQHEKGPPTRVQVPDGSTVQVDGKGEVVVTLPERQPLSKAWLDKAAGLKPEEQVRAVVAELQRRNPGFDGKHAARIRGDDVRIFGVVTDHISDISPVRGLRGLFSLSCPGSGWGKGRLSDLAPLAGTDIEILDIGWTAVVDLRPLRGLPLRELRCGGSRIATLAGLKGMKLTTLETWSTVIEGVAALEGMPLEHLSIGATLVQDLSPLRGLPLKTLDVHKTRVIDVSPLDGLLLESLEFDWERQKDLKVVRSMKTLKQINGKPATEFWKDVGPRKID